jgi:hypothetical protein
MMATLSVNAQHFADRPPFGQEKFYVASSLSGFDLNYDKNDKWKFDLQAKAGYLFDDNWMVMALAEYDYRKHMANTFKVGTGLRYYIEQNGLYVGLGANYVHQNHDFDDFMPSAHLGYAFFLNRTVTIEPELYYNHSFKDSDYSGFGLRIGFGIYFE